MPIIVYPHQTDFYKGKVRNVHYFGEQFITIDVSDRISAFDVILPREIPNKGQILNELAAYMLHATKEICPNWLLETPARHISFGYRCKPFKIEVVVRGTLTGHAWRTYKSGKRNLCGIALPEGMHENQFFATPIITPSTKAEAGHDEDISEAEIIRQQLATPEQWEQIKAYAFALYAKGCAMANERGLILADTKYEFGLHGDHVCLMDEIHTPDSSRYFLKEGFNDKVAKGKKPEQLSKEFVREWLISENFMGRPGDVMPDMTDAIVDSIRNRYIELFEKVTGNTFTPSDESPEQIHLQMLQCLYKYYPETV